MTRDYSNYDENNKIYTGSERKIGITIDSEDYILKFQKNSESGYINNHISEHLGSGIFNLLGEEAQITALGTYKGENVVVCKDFNKNNDSFIPFNGVGESSLERDKELYQYSYEDIIAMLKDNAKIADVNETIDRFWNMFIIDALLGNFDRHGANWGFIKKENKYRLAPVFDNGSSLFPRRNTEELMEEAMNSDDVIDGMIYKYPTSQIKLNNKKSSYYEVINSLAFDECNKALSRIYKRYDPTKIKNYILSQDSLSETQKRFYIFIVESRFQKIIKSSYDKLEVKNE
ncbi:MAG: HipA domain-containing protein [Bacillales bacterium]|nr:HipA domain-containing protein [Bacillales bacterium]